jgi:hypothetical protein
MSCLRKWDKFYITYHPGGIGFNNRSLFEKPSQYKMENKIKVQITLGNLELVIPEGSLFKDIDAIVVNHLHFPGACVYHKVFWSIPKSKYLPGMFPDR